MVLTSWLLSVLVSTSNEFYDSTMSFFGNSLTVVGRANVVSSFEVVQTVTHDANAFTQGLTFDPSDDTFVYESTGLYGSSSIRKVDLQSGQVMQQYNSPSDIFGEGLAYYYDDDTVNGAGGRLIHITWKSQRGFILDADTLQLVEEFSFSTTKNEGWGITYNPNTDEFIVSDGSEYLHFWNRNREELRKVKVTSKSKSGFCLFRGASGVSNLNELEWDDATKTVLANVWQTDNIVRIDPLNGNIITWYDMSDLYNNRAIGADVLNGIAFNPYQDELWLTGKKWPHMYQVRFDV